MGDLTWLSPLLPILGGIAIAVIGWLPKKGDLPNKLVDQLQEERDAADKRAKDERELSAARLAATEAKFEARFVTVEAKLTQQTQRADWTLQVLRDTYEWAWLLQRHVLEGNPPPPPEAPASVLDFFGPGRGNA